MSDFSEGHDLGKLQGKREEQSRIIKLLEDKGEHETLEMPTLKDEHIKELCMTCSNIALIKGDSK
jgi:hypothetical protein